MNETEARQAPQRTERAGLPVWWADVPGPYVASLMFRAGLADETLATNGITHLVEHLTLFPLGRREHSFNGFVDDTRCVFYASGERDEVLEFIRLAAASVCDLPVDRLEVERRVLRAEASGAGGVRARLRGHRFGAAGFGLINFPELGLRWLGPDEVRTWARERFTRGNAVLWLSGEPPEDLDLQLPDGARIPTPAPVSIVMQHPAYLDEGTGGAALSVVAPRSTALRVASTAASERLFDRVRRERGLAYGPYCDYSVVCADSAEVILGSDCADADAPVVMEEIWKTAQELSQTGATEEEIARHRRGAVRAAGEPDGRLGELDDAAFDELRSGRTFSTGVWMDELERLQPGDVAAAVAEALGSAILLGPAGARAPGSRFCPLVPRSPEPVEGRVFTPAYPQPPLPDGERVTIGERGVTYKLPQGELHTIEWSGCAAAERRPDGALVLRAHDGSWLTVSPLDWTAGEAVLDAVLEHLPPQLVIPDADAEVTELVERVAAERLATPGAVGHALSTLGSELGEREEPLDMAAGTSEAKPGLLVLTDRRVLWLNDEGGGLAFPFDELEAVNMPRLRGPLTITVSGKTLDVEVRPRSRARDIAAAIEQRSGAA